MEIPYASEMPIHISMLTNRTDKKFHFPPFAKIQQLENSKKPRLRIPDEEVQRKCLRVGSGWILSQEWGIWLESPWKHESEFGESLVGAGKGAEGELAKLLPWYSYIWRQSLKPSASPSNEQRKPGSNQRLENGLGTVQNTVFVSGWCDVCANLRCWKDIHMHMID